MNEEQMKVIAELYAENDKLENIIKELRSWLEVKIEIIKKQIDLITGIDIIESQMLLDYQDVLSKLKELEGGKND